MGPQPVPRRSSNLANVCGHGTTNKTTTAHQSKSLTAPATPHVEDPHQAGEDVPFIFISFRDFHGIHLQFLAEITTELGRAMVYCRLDETCQDAMLTQYAVAILRSHEAHYGILPLRRRAYHE